MPNLAKLGHTSILSCHKSCGADGHCVLWWDIPTQILFGNSNQTLRHYAVQQLKVQDPRTTKAYVSYMLAQYEEHNLLAQINSLGQQFHLQGATSPLIQEWERLDAIRVTTMLTAKEKCCKLRMGNVPWMPELQLTGQQLAFYRLWHKQIQRGWLNMRGLLCCAKGAQIVIPKTPYA